MKVYLAGLRTASEANQREHWRRRHARATMQKQSVILDVGQRASEFPPLPVVVTMTRVAPRAMDGDNLIVSFKAIRDSLATLLLPEAAQGNQHGSRGDDSDSRITWKYAQRKGGVRHYAVEITIESA